MSVSRSEQEACGLLGSFVLLVKSTVGASILTIPSAFVETGFIGGPILIVASAIIMLGTLRVLHKATAKSIDAAVYQDVVREHLGERAGVTAEIAIALYQILTCCAYVIVIGDVCTPLVEWTLPQMWTWCMRPAGIVIGSLPGFCLCFWPLIAQLSASMGVAVFIVAAVAAIIIVNYSLAVNVAADPAIMPGGWIEALAAIPVFAFGFQCHIPMPRIYTELSNDLRHYWDCVACCGYIFVGFLYGVVGYCGYRQFGGHTAGNIIVNYGQASSTTVLHILNGIVAIFGYALNHYMARSALYSLCERFRACKHREPMLQRPREIPRRHRIVLTVFIYICVLLVAFLFNDLGSLSTFVGGTVGSLVIFFFPAALTWKQSGASLLSKSAALLFALSGCICLIFGLRSLVVSERAT